MGWIKELWRATWHHWWALMSCAISNIVGVYALARQKDNLWLINSAFILAGIFVIVAIALAWRDEHAKLILEVAKNAKPQFKADIDCVVRDVLNEGHFFVHAHIVNLTSVSASIRRVSLKNHTTGELIPALRFDKCFVYREGETRLSATLTADGTFSRKESRIKDEIADILQSLTLPLIRGEGKRGWLLFQKAYSLQETEAPSLSLSLEDAFGDRHDSECVSGRYEYMSFSK
jgi:hypothetical protein